MKFKIFTLRWISPFADAIYGPFFWRQKKKTIQVFRDKIQSS